MSEAALVPELPRWLGRASDLLAEPDPGPTPFLVDQLIVDRAIGAVRGAPKVGKTWLLLELAISVVTGRAAFDRFEVPNSGPVVVVLEESGRAALHRRLDALSRGYGIRPAELADLLFAANERVRLDDPAWQKQLLEVAASIQPRAILFDPLARLKGASRNENEQTEMAPVLDFLRDLREASKSAIVFCHHTGHAGGHMRGTSDLEAYWESLVSVKRDGEIIEVASEHREAEPGPGLRYTLSWDVLTRSMRLSAIDAPPREKLIYDEILEYVTAHPGSTQTEIQAGVRRRRQDVSKALDELEAGNRGRNLYRTASRRADKQGRPREVDVWNPAPEATSYGVPTPGTASALGEPGEPGTVEVPAVRGAVSPGREPRPDALPRDPVDDDRDPFSVFEPEPW